MQSLTTPQFAARHSLRLLSLATLALGGCASMGQSASNDAVNTEALHSKVKNVVVIYAENRSFDNLFGHFPGANGIVNAGSTAQGDRDGSRLKTLPLMATQIPPLVATSNSPTLSAA